jgi:hypothetical protein
MLKWSSKRFDPSLGVSHDPHVLYLGHKVPNLAQFGPVAVQDAYGLSTGLLLEAPTGVPGFPWPNTLVIVTMLVRSS